MSYKIISDTSLINMQQVNDFVYAHPDGHFFQSADAFQLFHTVKNYQPILICCYDDHQITGSLLTVIQKEHSGVAGKFSSRSICWGGPLIKNNLPEIAELILKEYETKVDGKAIYTQMRNMFDCSFMADTFEENEYEYVAHLNYHVITHDRNAAMKKMSESKSRQIKKSLKAGARVEEALTLADVEHFYHILRMLYKVRAKKPLPDRSFFIRFFEQCCQAGKGKYLLIKIQDKIIGGIMCAITPGKAIYEWYIGGDDVDHKQYYPSVLATYAAIDYALQHNLGYFDFMGAGKPGKDYGVREFKSKFGGELKNFGRFEKVHNKSLMAIGKAGIRFLKYIKP